MSRYNDEVMHHILVAKDLEDLGSVFGRDNVAAVDAPGIRRSTGRPAIIFPTPDHAALFVERATPYINETMRTLGIGDAMPSITILHQPASVKANVTPHVPAAVTSQGNAEREEAVVYAFSSRREEFRRMYEEIVSIDPANLPADRFSSGFYAESGAEHVAGQLTSMFASQFSALGGKMLRTGSPGENPLFIVRKDGDIAITGLVSGEPSLRIARVLCSLPDFEARATSLGAKRRAPLAAPRP